MTSRQASKHDIYFLVRYGVDQELQVRSRGFFMTEDLDLNSLLSDFGLYEPAPPNRTQLHLSSSSNDADSEGEGEETIENIDTRVNSYVLQQSASTSSSNQEEFENDDAHADLDKLGSIYEKCCGCSKNCYLQFSLEEIRSNIYNMRELNKTEKDLLSMGTLKQLGSDNRCRSGERKCVRYEYIYNGIKTCQDAFLLINDIGLWTLRSHEAYERKWNSATVHGNHGRKAPNAFSHDTIKDAVQFLLNYDSGEGLPQPAAPRGRRETAPVFLPSKKSQLSIHQEYITACSQIEKQYVGLTTFKDLWKRCATHIKMAVPKDDVCNACEDFWQDIQLARTEDEKLFATEKYHALIIQSRKERDKYRECVEKSLALFERRSGRDAGSGDNFSCNDVHYTFDFSQYAKLPHHTRKRVQPTVTVLNQERCI